MGRMGFLWPGRAVYLDLPRGAARTYNELPRSGRGRGRVKVESLHAAQRKETHRAGRRVGGAELLPVQGSLGARHATCDPPQLPRESRRRLRPHRAVLDARGGGPSRGIRRGRECERRTPAPRPPLRGAGEAGDFSFHVRRPEPPRDVRPEAGPPTAARPAPPGLVRDCEDAPRGGAQQAPRDPPHIPQARPGGHRHLRPLPEARRVRG
jgi:hypothetical protein